MTLTESRATHVHQQEAAHLLNTYGSRPLLIERGEGCYLFDSEGHRYLDLVTGIGVNALGHGHPALHAALAEQAQLCLHTSNLYSHPYQGELAAKLTAWSGLDRVFFSNSGTEAMEIALKVARAHANSQGRRQHRRVNRIIALEHGYHGRTAGALAITSSKKYREPFEPLPGEVIFVPPNNVAALEAAATADTIAIVSETIQGEGGVRPLAGEFLAAIRDTATRVGAAWIADEVQCGLGRTGHRFAFQAFPEAGTPDIIALAKPLGGGLPLGATLFREDFARVITPGLHGSTFGGGPLACRMALAFLECMDELLPTIRERGEQLQSLGRALRSPAIREVRGAGLMLGIELNRPGAPIVEAAREAGLIINCTHGNILRLLPPYVITSTQLEEALGILERVL